jgi:NitT/TauT family transport system ATP-binding protein
MPEPHLVLDNVAVKLGGKLIVRDVSLRVNKRELVCVIGTSGGGKTTLLRAIAGLVPVSAGTIHLGGSRVTGPSPRTALIFQHFGLFPWKNVLANVTYGLRVQGRHADPGRIRELLESLGIGHVSGYYPAQLSGGMKQRVGIARALATEPELLLLDEPFSSLDAITRESLQDEVLRIWEASEMTAVLVTHDIDEALLMGDRVIVLSGPPERTVTLEVPVDIPRPRGGQELRSHEDYPCLRKLLRDALR